MLICAALASLPAAAQAEAAVLSAAWNWNPLIGAALAFVAWRYMDGVWSLWRRSGVNRGVARWQVACFWLGLLALFAALISPLDGLSEQLFYAHMLQHLLLMLVAPPLLLLGLPPVALAWAMPGRWGRSLAQWWHRQTGLQALWRLITEPVSAWIIFAIVVWLWHLPGLYQAALRDPVVHALEHACFLGSALLFWWVLPLHGREHRMSYGAGVLYVFTTALHSSILGVLLTFSTSVWYADYAVTAPLWGVTPLEDQQLAGLIMWIPAGVFYLIAVLALLAAWLHAMERRSQWELEKPSLK
jgi:cytochrome c oxidase assembly factor CtaG